MATKQPVPPVSSSDRPPLNLSLVVAVASWSEVVCAGWLRRIDRSVELCTSAAAHFSTSDNRDGSELTSCTLPQGNIIITTTMFRHRRLEYPCRVEGWLHICGEYYYNSVSTVVCTLMHCY